MDIYSLQVQQLIRRTPVPPTSPPGRKPAGERAINSRPYDKILKFLESGPKTTNEVALHVNRRVRFVREWMVELMDKGLVLRDRPIRHSHAIWRLK